MLSLELLASSREVRSSFFIGMMAEQSGPAQLVPSSVASRPIHNPTKPRSSIDLTIFTESLPIGQLWAILILRGSVALRSKLVLMELDWFLVTANCHDPAWFIENLPKLPKDGELQFWLALGASSSFAKAVSFWAWTACRAPEAF